MYLKMKNISTQRTIVYCIKQTSDFSFHFFMCLGNCTQVLLTLAPLLLEFTQFLVMSTQVLSKPSNKLSKSSKGQFRYL